MKRDELHGQGLDSRTCGEVGLNERDVLPDDLVWNVPGFVQQVVEGALGSVLISRCVGGKGRRAVLTSYSTSFLSSICSLWKNATPAFGQFTCPGQGRMRNRSRWPLHGSYLVGGTPGCDDLENAKMSSRLLIRCPGRERTGRLLGQRL